MTKMTVVPESYNNIRAEIVELLHAARSAAARSVNALMTATYWEIGRRIVLSEQAGEQRAEYGEVLIQRLAKDLSASFGRGFGARNLAQMRSFYGGQHLVGKIVERVVSFRGSLLGTQNQPDRRVLSRLHPMLAGVVQIEVHLPCVRVTELTNLEVDDEQAAQATVKEDEVDTKPGVVDAKPTLATEERKIVAQLQEEICEMLDERLFQI